MAYQQGVEAFEAGFSDTYNPYPIGSVEYHSWNKGWVDAKLGLLN